MDKLNRLQLDIEDMQVRIHYLEKKVEEMSSYGQNHSKLV